MDLTAEQRARLNQALTDVYVDMARLRTRSYEETYFKSHPYAVSITNGIAQGPSAEVLKEMHTWMHNTLGPREARWTYAGKGVWNFASARDRTMFLLRWAR